MGRLVLSLGQPFSGHVRQGCKVPLCMVYGCRWCTSWEALFITVPPEQVEALKLGH